ncbi:amidohydrolase family protein [Granulicella cerasi]|uniref:Amidohydrolase family protein n=2 Tax=Granulicella cerasi TaxID=741063 RepID=A0ABW1Z6J4_9BACT
MAFDAQPRYSPDGKHIVFVSDRDGADNVWIADADGTHARVITKERHNGWVSPEWTPDGRYILVSKTSDVFGGRELWMLDALGGSGVQITKASTAPKTPSGEQSNVSGAVESPDGRYIYYSRRKGLLGYNATFPMWQIVRRDTTNGIEDVVTNEYGSAIRPRISPDGKWLVYGTRWNAKSGLRARELSTGAEHWLAYPIDRDEQEGLGTRDQLPGYAFTPDSSAVLVSYGGHLHHVDVLTGKETAIPFTAEVNQQLGPLSHSEHRVETGPVVARIASDARLSPDGKQVAFSALGSIFVADVNTGKPHRLTQSQDAEFEPAWSADGRTLAYVTWDAESGGALWTIPSDGSAAPHKLTQIPGFFEQPVWSLDGKNIYAIRSSMEARERRRVEYQFAAAAPVPGSDFVRIPVDGSAYETLAPARGMSRPQFINGSDRVFYNGPQGLVSSRLDGTDVQELVAVKTRDIQGQKEMGTSHVVVISPDGTRAVALVNHQAWLLDLPRVGGSAFELDPGKPSLTAKRLNVEGVDDLGWSPDGSQIYWTTGATLFRLPLATVLQAELADAEKTTAAPKDAKDPNGKKAAEDAAKKPAGLDAAHVRLVVEEPRAVPTGSILLSGAKIITMKGDQVLPTGDVLVTGDRIIAVGPKGSLKVPTDAKVMDVTGKTIIPGLIDIHAHWTQMRRSVLEMEAWPLEANLAYGVTAGRDPQTFTVDIFAYQDLADTGRVVGPRAFSTGPGIFLENNFQSLKDAEDTVRRYTDYYRTHLLKSYMVGNRGQRQWMVEASKELGAMPTTEGGIDTRLDLTQIIDGFSGNEHNYPQMPIYKDIVQLQAQAGTTYTPTLVVSYGGPNGTQYFVEHTNVHDDPKVQRFIDPYVLAHDTERSQWTLDSEYIFPQQAGDAAKILRAGGNVGLGGHGMMQGLQCHWELWSFVMGGMSPLEALSIGTIQSAKAIGLDKDLGSLEQGKLADLVVLDRDPLADIHNSDSVHYVMRGGFLYKGENLDEVWPAEHKQPLRWWEKEGVLPPTR